MSDSDISYTFTVKAWSEIWLLIGNGKRELVDWGVSGRGSEWTSGRGSEWTRK